MWVAAIGNAVAILFCLFLSTQDIWFPLIIYIGFSLVVYIIHLSK